MCICSSVRCKDPDGLPSQGGAFLPWLQLFVFIHRKKESYLLNIALRVIVTILFKVNETDDKKDGCSWNTKSPGSASNPYCFLSYDLSC